MTDEELMLALDEALEKLALLHPYWSGEDRLVEDASALITEVRNQLRYGLGDI